MKKFLVLFVLCLLIGTVASAEFLNTATMAGKGKWAVLGGYLQNSNLYGISAQTLGGASVGVMYGITEDFDILVTYAALTGSSISMPITPVLTATGATLNAPGVALKYNFLDEGISSPVTVSGMLNYKSLSGSIKYNLGADSTVTGSQTSVGVNVSKLYAPFIPYAGVAYRSTNSSDSTLGSDNYTQIDLTIGTAIAWSKQGAVFVEYTNQAISDATAGFGGNHTSPQIGAGVGYSF